MSNVIRLLYIKHKMEGLILQKVIKEENKIMRLVVELFKLKEMGFSFQ